MQANTETTANKTGIKTLDKIAEIPVVNSALTNVSGYYGQIKEKNVILNIGCNLAELSFQTMKFATTPLTTLCSKKIESVDSYLSGKIDSIENTFPAITQPTDKITSSAYELYDKTNTMVKNPKNTLNNLKNLTVVGASTCGNKVLETCLENRYSKVVSQPVLDFTEKSLNYYIPSSITEVNKDKNTVQRIYDINKRVYNHVYDITYLHLSNLHEKFQQTIIKIVSLKNLVDEMYNKKKEQIIETILGNSLVQKCKSYIKENNLSMARFEKISKGYLLSILVSINDIIDRYIFLFDKFSASINFNRLKDILKNINLLKTHINKESFSVIINKSIDYAKKIDQLLISFRKTIFPSIFAASVVSVPVVTDSVLAAPIVDGPIVPAPLVPAPVVSAPVVSASVVPAPVVTAPVVPEPVVTAPVVSEPVVSAPVVSEPVVSAPVVPEPVVSAPVISEPVVSAPVVPAPVVTAPVVPEPVVSARVVSEPVVPAPVVSATVVPEPVVSAPVVTEPVVNAPIEAKPIEAKPIESIPIEAKPAVASSKFFSFLSNF